jgi:hypothetical protein
MLQAIGGDMFIRIAAAALALVATPAAAQVQGQYDLACRWDRNDTRHGVSTSTLQGVEQRFRVDTARMAYCEAECSNLWPIQQITTSAVVFRSELSGDTLFHLEYQRDGAFRFDEGYWQAGRIIWGRGRCERKPFSSFPAAATDHSRKAGAGSSLAQERQPW